jgi:hypothetical protein
MEASAERMGHGAERGEEREGKSLAEGAERRLLIGLMPTFDAAQEAVRVLKGEIRERRAQVGWSGFFGKGVTNDGRKNQEGDKGQDFVRDICDDNEGRNCGGGANE